MLSRTVRSTPSAPLHALSRITLNFVDLAPYNFNVSRGRKVDFCLLFWSIRNFHLTMCRPSRATFQCVSASKGRLLPFATTCNQLAVLQQIIPRQKSEQNATKNLNKSQRCGIVNEREKMWRRIEVVITGRTRNAFAFRGTWVRIPPSPPD